MAQRNPSKITTHFEVDDPIQQDAKFEFDPDDRQYIDNQIRGTQQRVIDLAKTGVGGTVVVADDIAKSDGADIDRVRGLRGIPLVGTDGVTPRIGGSWEYNEQGTHGHKLTKPVVFHANHYGCVGDGITDDTDALQALFAAASAAPGSTLAQGVGSGVVVFPNDAVYKCDGRLSFDYRQSIVVRGPAKIHFTGSGSGPFIKLLSCADWIFEDIHFTYENAAFSGDIVQTGHGISGSDVSGITFERCQFYGTADALGYHGAASCLSLKNCIDIRIHDCHFTAAKIGIDGYDTTLGFANTVLVDGCIFHKLGNGVPTDLDFGGCAGIHNPGEAWSIINNTFEPLQGAGYTEVSANAIVQDLTYFSWALYIAGNWIGDGDAVGPWLTLKPLGGVIAGNLISGGNTAVKIGGGFGVSITGNRISGAIEFVRDGDGGTSSGVHIAGNTIQAGTAYLGLGYVTRLVTLGNEDSADNFLSTPLSIGDADYNATYTRIILSGTKTFDPGTVASGAFAESDDIAWTGSHLGAAFAFGVTPTPPAGVLVDAKMHTDGNARVQIFNMSGTDYTPGTLTFKFHMWE